jgi:hypothetical protein
VKAIAERLGPEELSELSGLARVPSSEMRKAMEGVTDGVNPGPASSSNDTFVGRFLTTLGGGFLTGSLTISAAVALKSGSPNWYAISALLVGCWLVGGVLIAAGLKWPKWKPDHEVLAKRLVAASNSILAWSVLLLLIAIGPAAAVWFMNSGGSKQLYTQPQLDAAVSQAVAALQSQLNEVLKQRDTKAGGVRADGERQLQGPPGQFAPVAFGPINWNLNNQLIVASGGGQTARVNGLLFQGQSLTPVRFKEAHVISGLTGHTGQLKVAVHSIDKELPVTEVDIPTGAPVQLDLTFDPALPVRDFFDQWGKFRLVISYENGGSLQHDFDEDLVREKVQLMLPDSFGPHVTPRETR